jgi:16S rRNA U516 pseudouridylate synthase RsuA-like enzyme
LLSAVANQAGVDVRSVWRAAASRRNPPAFFHFIFHKPRGVLCQPNQRGREAEGDVHEALPPLFPRVPFAGRLDADTEGLLFFSDNGKLLQLLAEPSRVRKKEHNALDSSSNSAFQDPQQSEHKKIYQVKVAFSTPEAPPIPSAEPWSGSNSLLQIRKLAAVASMGCPLDVKGRSTAPAVVSLLEMGDVLCPEDSSATSAHSPATASFWVSITIKEGKNHQVRRLCKRSGLHVLRLVRTEFGPLALVDCEGSVLPPGSARALTPREVLSCYKDSGMCPIPISMRCPDSPSGKHLVSDLVSGTFPRSVGTEPSSPPPPQPRAAPKVPPSVLVGAQGASVEKR